MVAVGMVEVAVHEVIHMIPVRHRLMPAARPVTVIFVMGTTLVLRRARLRILLGDLQHMLVHMIRMWMMKVPVMKIIYMILVADGGVAAVRSMFMRVGSVGIVHNRAHSNRQPSRFFLSVKYAA